MTTPKILIGIAVIIVLGSSFVAYSNSTSTVLECLDATGLRLGWANDASECPSGTTPTRHVLTDACEPPTAATCSGELTCSPGTPGCPRPQPMEYVCCAAVSGEPDCWLVDSAVECGGDELIFECSCGLTQPDGSVDCVAAC